MKYPLLISACAFFLLISCQKEKLPKLTEEGKNTFGCKINGKNWVPHGTGAFGGSEPLNGGYLATYSFNTTSNNVQITAYDKSIIIELYIRDVKQPGLYLLNFNTLDFTNTNNPANYGYYSPEDKNIFTTTTQFTGQVDVTRADTINKIVSGTFEFMAVNKEGKTVKITDGRFDIQHP